MDEQLNEQEVPVETVEAEVASEPVEVEVPEEVIEEVTEEVAPDVGLEASEPIVEATSHVYGTLDDVAANSVARLARAVYQAEVAIRDFAGSVIPDWNSASSAVRGNLVEVVSTLLSNPEMTAEGLHKELCDGFLSSGWVFGAVLSERDRTHPCILPFEMLPDLEKLILQNTVFVVRLLS